MNSVGLLPVFLRQNALELYDQYSGFSFSNKLRYDIWTWIQDNNIILDFADYAQISAFSPIDWSVSSWEALKK